MWLFKRKRPVDGTVTKYKERLVVHGDLKDLTEEIGGDNTYAPVVDWGTIRLVFNSMVQYGWKSKSIDIKNAFAQSNLPEPIYIELPTGGYD